MTETKNIIAFDGTEIDPDRGELRRDGNPVAVEPQVFDLVRFLAERPGRVVSRDELIEGVWHGRIVSDSAIASRISAAREAVGDNGTDQRVIKTVARRGFLFLPVPKTEMPAADTPRQIDAVRGDRPTIAVLPFRNLSGDPAQSYFSEGIAEDILTNLARFEEMVVLARQSAFAFDPLADNAMQFSRKLGVDYGLEGSVQRSQTRVRVTARLFDAASGEALWADRFDRVPDDIFAIQDEISGAIVNALVGEVSEHRYVRLQAQAPRKLGAYDHALRAQQMLWNVSREAVDASRAEARSAIDLEPDFARAHALLSWAELTADGNGWGRSGPDQFDDAVSHARIAVALDEKNPWAHALLGCSAFWRDRDVAFAVNAGRIGVRLNPSNAHIRMFLASIFAYSGDGDSAIEELNLAIDLNPLFPSLYLMHRSRAHFVLQDFAAALADIERAAVALPKHPGAYALLAACLEASGRHDEAEKSIRKVRELSPEFTCEYARKSLPFSRKPDLERFCDLVSKAGLPERAE